MKNKGNPNIAELGKATRMQPGCELWKKRRLFKHGLLDLLDKREIRQQYEVSEDGKVTKRVDKTIKYTDDLYAVILKGLLQKAMSGDEWAQNKVMEMVDGKAPDKRQIAGDPDNPTPIPIIRLPAKNPNLGNEPHVGSK